MSMELPDRQTCGKCGGSLRFVAKRQADNGHHWSVFRCPDCDREVLRG